MSDMFSDQTAYDFTMMGEGVLGKEPLPRMAPASDSSSSSCEFDRKSALCDSINSATSDCAIPEELREIKQTDCKHVTFGDLEVRLYPVILGDHPDCAMGPPITIGWDYVKRTTLSIDVYESERPRRRKKEELQINWVQRKRTLRRLVDATDDEMREAARQASHIRELRSKTVKRLPFEFIEAPIESLRRKIQRRFSGNGAKK